MIFSRKRGSGQRPQATGSEKSSGPERESSPRESSPRASAPSQTRASARRAATGGGVPEQGPYDSAAAPAGGEMLDLGALRIPVLEGVEVRVQADQEGRVQQVVLICGESALQLGVFAAPRTEPIWDEVREEFRAQLRSDGFASQEVEGEYGTELRSRVRTPEGPKDIRFVGVNGPRWMVRGIFQGPVAADPAAAPLLTQCLNGLVVYRGGEAMPAKEGLPLRLPREITEQAQRSAGGAEPGQDSPDEPPAGRGPAPRRR